MTEQNTADGSTKEPPVARIVNPAGRSTVVPLQFPVEFDGKHWESVEIRRCTGKEVQDYLEGMGTAAEFVLPPVIQCPLAVWHAMDADDQYTVDEAAQAFMPRRLKAAVELLSGTGANTSDK
ncbi:hypothetical protein ASE36_00115 [Rhizobium sp. Root274]|uniref:phage tail assembly protein n=1 Tax=unclassified Rhizobium TaxID=2613769 RepID=UPI000714D16F|nr:MULTISPECIES: phage tail assembly protein [unclassified Rhizobium]KQW30744.1 hypothetical protein ASC71_00115 [Rhizobium sp. Root1240]KRD32291.1 hypothetical protein ASE36_00115 [Rhizobium sp. Root274]